jgi:hypothetical protein
MCTSSKKWIKIGMKTPIHLNNKGNNVIICSSLGKWPCLLPSSSIHYTISLWVESTMIISIKVQKLFLVIKISIYRWVWWRKRWETSFLACVPFSKAIAMTISQSVSWVVICSFPQGHLSKWVHRSSMVWPHWHFERLATMGCGKSKWVHDVVRKWIKDKQNAGVARQIYN